ncbi:MAG TPA: hypothetical protein VGK20_17945 [Candidatus Binatia bacterium]|jgi:hypothetical protein
MPQNATGRETPPQLSQQKTTALEAIVMGSTVTDAARAAGVSRETVHRWLRDDYEFQAERNAAVRELRTAASARMERAAAAAAEVVLKAVENGNVAVALKVLEGFGRLAGQAPAAVGPSSARELCAQDEAAVRAAERQRRRQEAMESLKDQIGGFGL